MTSSVALLLLNCDPPEWIKFYMGFIYFKPGYYTDFTYQWFSKIGVSIALSNMINAVS